MNVKSLLSMLCIIVLNIVNLNAQDYGFLNSQNQWIVKLEENYQNTPIIGYGFTNTLFGFDDSMHEVNNVSYKLLQIKKRMSQFDWPNQGGPGWNYRGGVDTTIQNIAYFREDSNHNIYCKMIVSGSYDIAFDSSEFLFMRPDLGIGDTLIYTAAMPPETLVVRNRYFEVFLNYSTQVNDSALSYTFDVLGKNTPAYFSYLYGYANGGPVYSMYEVFENKVPDVICFWNGYFTNNGLSRVLNQCANSGALIPVNSLSLQETSIQKLSLYPNPVTNRLFIQGDDAATSTIAEAAIFDISGKSVKHQKMSHIKYVETHELNNGMYILEINDSNGNRGFYKFIKE